MLSENKWEAILSPVGVGKEEGEGSQWTLIEASGGWVVRDTRLGNQGRDLRGGRASSPLAKEKHNVVGGRDRVEGLT